MKASIPTFLLLLLASTTNAASDFISSSCGSTTYPPLCEQCLKAHAASIRRSPRRAAHVALAISYEHANTTAALVSLVSSRFMNTQSQDVVGVVQECMQDMTDGVQKLQKSIRQMGRLGRAGSTLYTYRISNVQTWASAALTDVTTCLDILDRHQLGAAVAVRTGVVNVAQLTSNALALLNKIMPPNT